MKMNELHVVFVFLVPVSWRQMPTRKVKSLEWPGWTTTRSSRWVRIATRASGTSAISRRGRWEGEKRSRRRRRKRKRQHQKSPVAALLGLLPNERRKWGTILSRSRVRKPQALIPAAHSDATTLTADANPLTCNFRVALRNLPFHLFPFFPADCLRSPRHNLWWRWNPLVSVSVFIGL